MEIHPHPPIVAPSLLAGNHANLAESAQIIAYAGASWVHLDIMDGHFAPNITFGPQTLKDLRKTSELLFDIHLMLDHPDKYVKAFAQAGANSITIHEEPDCPTEDTLKKIRELDCQCGISINPNTPAKALIPYLDKVDLVLIMTVQPGFGGQTFNQDCLEKIRQVSTWRSKKKLDFRIEVDGGIDLQTGKLCAQHGADTFVAGTAFFKSENPSIFVKTFEGFFNVA